MFFFYFELQLLQKNFFFENSWTDMYRFSQRTKLCVGISKCAFKKILGPIFHNFGILKLTKRRKIQTKLEKIFFLRIPHTISSMIYFWRTYEILYGKFDVFIKLELLQCLYFYYIYLVFMLFRPSFVVFVSPQINLLFKLWFHPL